MLKHREGTGTTENLRHVPNNCALPGSCQEMAILGQIPPLISSAVEDDVSSDAVVVVLEASFVPLP